MIILTANLLDVGGALRHGFNRVTGQDEFVLLGGRLFGGDTFSNLDNEGLLLTQEVSDFNDLLAILFGKSDVDREMGVHVSHLVLVTLGDTGDHVGDQRLDSSQSSNVLSVTMVDKNLDRSVVNLFEVNVDVLQVLGEFTSGTSDLDHSGLDVDGDTFRDFEELFRDDELHS